MDQLIVFPSYNFTSYGAITNWTVAALYVDGAGRNSFPELQIWRRSSGDTYVRIASAELAATANDRPLLALEISECTHCCSVMVTLSHLPACTGLVTPPVTSAPSLSPPIWHAKPNKNVFIHYDVISRRCHVILRHKYCHPVKSRHNVYPSILRHHAVILRNIATYSCKDVVTCTL